MVLLLSAVSRCQVWGLVRTCVVSAVPYASFTLNWERNYKRTEKEKVLHILRESPVCQWKIWCLWAVGCYNASFVCCVALEMLCVVRFPRVRLLSLPIWWHSDGDLRHWFFFCHRFLAFLLFSWEAFNHFISCHFLLGMPFFFCPTIEDTTVSYSNAPKDVLKYRNSL